MPAKTDIDPGKSRLSGTAAGSGDSRGAAFSACHKLRENNQEFSSCLQAAVSKWTELWLPAYTKTGFGDSRGERVIAPTHEHRRRVQALLRFGMSNDPQISPLYLDYRQLKKVNERFGSGKRLFKLEPGRGVRITSEATAAKVIKTLYLPEDYYPDTHDRGPLMDLGIALGQPGSYHRRDSVFFGSGVWEGWSINSFFSKLIEWDDRYCYGLVKFSRGVLAYRDDYVQAFLYLASADWIRELSDNQESIYSQYPYNKLEQ